MYTEEIKVTHDLCLYEIANTLSYEFIIEMTFFIFFIDR